MKLELLATTLANDLSLREVQELCHHRPRWPLPWIASSFIIFAPMSQRHGGRWGVSVNGATPKWFILENPIKIDDWDFPL